MRIDVYYLEAGLLEAMWKVLKTADSRPLVENLKLKYIIYYTVKRVKVTRSYQVTIPAEVRRALGIRVGDYLSVKVVGDRIVLEKVEDELPTFRAGRKVGEREIEEALAKGLARSLRGG